MAYPIQEPRLLKSINVSDGDVNYCRFSPCGQTVATASAGGMVKLWNTKDGNELLHSPLKDGHSEKFYVNSCVFSPSGDVLVTVGSDHKAIVWSMNLVKEIGNCNGHSASVKDCAISPNEKFLLTASADKTAKLWDLSSCKNLATFQKGDSVMSSCCFSFDGGYSVVGANSGDVFVWETSTGNFLCQVNADDLGVNCVASAPQSQHGGKWRSLVVACCNNSEVKCYLIDYVKGKHAFLKEAVLKEHSGAVYHCQFTAHYTHFATCGADKKVVLWTSGTWEVVWKVQAHNRFVTCCSFSPNTCHLATTSNDKTLKLWDISGGRVSDMSNKSHEKVAMDTTEACDIPMASIEDVCSWLNSLAKQPMTSAVRDAVAKLKSSLENSNVL